MGWFVDSLGWRRPFGALERRALVEYGIKLPAVRRPAWAVDAISPLDPPRERLRAAVAAAPPGSSGLELATGALVHAPQAERLLADDERYGLIVRAAPDPAPPYAGRWPLLAARWWTT